MRRRFLPLLIALLLSMTLTFTVHAATSDDFPRLHTYNGQFVDISPSNWFYSNVTALYELGLTNGQGSPDHFAPNDNMTLAEALTLAARLRSLYDYKDSEVGSAAFSGDTWFSPYVQYLQSMGIIGTEFDNQYRQVATRAQVAYILSRCLPAQLFDEINAEAVTVGYARRAYITDVTDYTPYRSEILQLYRWGIVSGMDHTGAFHPSEPIQRSQVAAMLTRLVDPDLCLSLNWVLSVNYSREGTTMPDLIFSDGTFHSAPAVDDLLALDDNIRYLFSRGERCMILRYGSGVVTEDFANQLLSNLLSTARLYVEQGYNQATCSYSPLYGSVTVVFSSNLCSDELLDAYRSATIEAAIIVHDQLWQDGLIIPSMTEYEKARVYFDWLCNNCTYDYAATDSSISHSGYGALLNGLAVCDGYTSAYNLLLKLEGIECTTYSTADHIWTIAMLDNRSYHIDLTWGDQTATSSSRYFGMTEAFSLARFN